MTGKPIRGYLYGNGGSLAFDYNPPDFTTNRSTNYVTHSAPGVEYPRIQFVSGDEETFSIELFLANDTAGVEDQIAFLESMAPPFQNTVLFQPPPIITFSYGTFVRQVVLAKYSIKREWFNKSLVTLRATATLDFKVVLG